MPIRHKFNHSFVSYDFDVDHSNRRALFDEIDMCPKLDKAHKSLTDSEFFGLLTENSYKDQPVDIKRNKDIVKNLELLSYQLENNYTIGWAGQHRCVDFHHHLTATNSPLLEKIKFININTVCSDMEGKGLLSSLLAMYYFSECSSDPRLTELINRFLPFEEVGDDIQTPQEILDDQWEKDFIKSEYVLNLNVSISDEPGSILPWQVADLDIFN